MWRPFLNEIHKLMFMPCLTSHPWEFWETAQVFIIAGHRTRFNQLVGDTCHYLLFASISSKLPIGYCQNHWSTEQQRMTTAKWPLATSFHYGMLWRWSSLAGGNRTRFNRTSCESIWMHSSGKMCNRRSERARGNDKCTSYDYQMARKGAGTGWWWRRWLLS